MFAHHHVRREPLSVRERMSSILVPLQTERYVDFQRRSIRARRIGVTVTFLAILELIKETLIDVVQTEAFGPIHIRAAQAGPGPSESAKTAFKVAARTINTMDETEIKHVVEAGCWRLGGR